MYFKDRLSIENNFTLIPGAEINSFVILVCLFRKFIKKEYSRSCSETKVLLEFIVSSFLRSENYV